MSGKRVSLETGERGVEAEDIEDQGRRGAGEGAIDDPEREHCCCNDPAHFQRLVHAQDRGDGRKQVSCRGSMRRICWSSSVLRKRRSGRLKRLRIECKSTRSCFNSS